MDEERFRQIIREEIRAALGVYGPYSDPAEMVASLREAVGHRRPCGREIGSACPEQSPYTHYCACEGAHALSSHCHVTTIIAPEDAA